MPTTKIYRRCLLVVVLCLMHSALAAQNDIGRERRSLKGISAVGFTVNLELSTTLTKYASFDVTSLTEQGHELLEQHGIDTIQQTDGKRFNTAPYLYLHINSMDAGRGLVPFALALYFYQPVTLQHNNRSTSAITWQSSSVGIVSYDQMSRIDDAIQQLMKKFITDYNQINGAN